MKLIRNEINRSEVVIANFNTCRVTTGIQFGIYDQALLRGCVGNQVDDYFMTDQGATTPILGDERKHPMLNFVPFAGTRRKMTNANPKPQISRQILQGDFPQPTTAAIAATTVGGDQQFLRQGITLPTHFDPPSSNRSCREARGVVINADTHPTLVLCQIIDTVGNGFAEFLIHKVVNADFLRFAFGLPFSPAVFKVANQFFLFGINRDDRLTAILELTHCRVDILKLSIPIRMRLSFSRLAIALQTVTGRFQQATN